LSYLLIATDISDLKKNENELNKVIARLVRIINALRALRIENIEESIDVLGRKNKIEIVNNNLFKEIEKLNRLIVDLKRKQDEKKT